METALEILILASRYWFVLLMVLIIYRLAVNVFREYRIDRETRRNVDKASLVGHLVWLTDAGQGNGNQIYWFALPKEAVVGSSKACDVRITETSVRGQHAMTTYQNGVLFIKRLSQAPVWVSGVECPIEGVLSANDGDTVKLGEVTLVLTLDGGMA